MDISRYSELLEKEFVAQLQTKPSWGKNEVVGIFKDAQIKALRELVKPGFEHPEFGEAYKKLYPNNY